MSLCKSHSLVVLLISVNGRVSTNYLQWIGKVQADW